jgi:hypothetical protein
LPQLIANSTTAASQEKLLTKPTLENPVHELAHAKAIALTVGLAKLMLLILDLDDVKF